ncbi:MAG: carbohydrate porin [Deltaproteobacteria bacterium]|nr:carbohydrate porin [Deltaproteobacteria bacterium]
MRSAIAVTLVLVGTHSAFAQPNGGAPPPPEDPQNPSPTPEPTPPPPEPEPVNPVPPAEPPKPVAVVEIVATPPAPLPVSKKDTGFRFGSYGRVVAGSDLRGGKPEAATVVAHGPRIVEDSYFELDFQYSVDTPTGMRLRPVFTLAFDGTLFHDTGNFDAQPAIRNVYLDAQLTKDLTGWVGSRMYRGDDIYLFDYWPLDDQNTVGGGLLYRKSESATGGDAVELAAHVGFNRLEEPSEFQFQQIDVPDPEQGARTIEQLNRQRIVGSATASYLLIDRPESANFKLKLHGEVHGLGSGTRQRRTDGTFEELPADTGYLIGAQLGTWGFAPSKLNYRRHLNLFMRYARGLAAFDELAPPTSFGGDLKSKRASELTFGASGNWDHPRGSVMLGALSRRFVDADGNTTDFDDGWEYTLAVRPLARVMGPVFAGADVSYQARFPRGLNPVTQRAEDPGVFQIAPMIVFSPMGPSGYDRPQIRLVYRAAHFNAAARDSFVDQDPRQNQTWTHFLGVQAEWWFNSSTYMR